MGESEDRWDGFSCEVKKGVVFKSREEINKFMTLYKENNCCHFCVYSGGVTEKCTSRKVTVEFHIALVKLSHMKVT